MTHSISRFLPRLLAFMAAASVMAASAQMLPVPENVVQLSAVASVEVPQDELAIQLQATREGPDPVRVQAELKTVLDAALAEARRDAQPGAVRRAHRQLQRPAALQPRPPHHRLAGHGRAAAGRAGHRPA